MQQYLQTQRYSVHSQNLVILDKHISNQAANALYYEEDVVSVLSLLDNRLLQSKRKNNYVQNAHTQHLSHDMLLS